ncbi:AAA family ATPase [Bradyrhizobium sp. 192]|uniref:AAA family ATPase n=1 Tax=Bradyrhizobium sp. 192 TaxID=2782660 RepID=UPI001FFF7254|nr:AAA family ATPase [Bradyrhizobium sp. 192]UPJ60300.1 AAA family ATPase [Bradyrhizobium sp. 192]
MSGEDATDDVSDSDLPRAIDDVVSTGAAADSAGWNTRLEGLPRLLRYAILVGDGASHVEQRLIAEIYQLCPRLPHTAAWAAALDVEAGLALAAELDRRAALDSEPTLRSVADCVRLLSLPTPRDIRYFEDHRRVGKALVQAFNAISGRATEALCCDLERCVFGWAALPTCTDLLRKGPRRRAAIFGKRMARHRVSAAATATRRQIQDERRSRKEARVQAAGRTEQPVSDGHQVVPAHHLRVASLSSEEMKNAKLKDVIGPLKGAINTALPLVEVPPLHEVRCALVREFPYARDVVDFALADLIGRTTVRLRPLVLIGDSGGGKSRFARRLGEALGLNVWRTDASRSDGAAFGGTDRRWYSAEPCHPFLAIAQSGIANPLVLIDEIDKAPTRSDYGRLWDCLLGFLDCETSARYPDPALQTNLNLSEVSFVATANSLDPLPTPIRDRLRVVRFPKPGAHDLDALLPAIITDIARELGLDESWMPRLDGIERAAVARHWRGGSVRRLHRVVEAILRERGLGAALIMRRLPAL